MDQEGRWYLELDSSICDAHGICALRCSERIRLDEWGYAIVSSEPIVEDRVLRQAKRAIAACPEGALQLRQRRGETSSAHTSAPTRTSSP
jgi:ferredoxin